VFQLLNELPVLVLYALGSGLLSFVGLELERLGLASLGAGEFVLGGWFLLMGGVALYIGLYAIAYNELRPRLRELLAAGGDA
jgi:hypothetical protein